MYFWVHGVYFNVRLEDDRSCILIIIAADKDGNKELLAVSDGFRESKLAWKELLLNLKRRGLASAPKLAVGDGALGFWAAFLKYLVIQEDNAAGCTRPPISRIRCQRAYRPRQSL